MVGPGELGSPTTMQLTIMGVSHLHLVDRDVVELSNLQRQNLYGARFLDTQRSRLLLRG
ncbi:MAG: ThiF family adenylyltransferase [Candidatus Bathyarchaeia archaeon]